MAAAGGCRPPCTPLHTDDSGRLRGLRVCGQEEDVEALGAGCPAHSQGLLVVLSLSLCACVCCG